MTQSKVLNPESINEVLSMIEEYGEDTRVIAGGQSLVPMISLGLYQPNFLINLSNCKDLTSIKKTRKILNIGAMVSVSELINSNQINDFVPVLDFAAKKVATPHVRNFGTVVGNVCHADPSSDLIPALLCLNAQIDLLSVTGERCVSIGDFITGPYSTNIRSGEIASSVTCHVERGSKLASYKKIARRAGDLGIATCAANLTISKGLIKYAGISVGGYLQKAIRLVDIEKNLINYPINESLKSINQIGKIDVVEDTILPEGSLTSSYLSGTFSRLVKLTLRDAIHGR